MRLFTIASPSHMSLLKDYFIPSVEKIGEYELTVMGIPQYGDSSFGLLPAEYYNIAFANHGKVHNSGDPVIIPENIRIFHANWTVGIDNKVELLKLAIKNNDTDN